MQKESAIGICFIVVVVGILAIGGVWAYEITLTAVNATYATVSINYQENVYAYEVNLDYTGSIGGVTFSSFLGAGATYGSATRDSILSGYGSRLDSTRTGVNASGELFNVTHVGGLSRRYALIIYANGTEEYKYYNNTGGDGDDGGNGGGGGGGGGGGAPLEAGDFSVDELISVEIKQGETKRKSIRVTNNKDTALTIESITVSQSIERFVKISESSFSVPGGGSKSIIIDFLASEREDPDTYLGKITLKSGSTEKFVGVVIDVKATKPLFDVIVDVEEGLVAQGEDVTFYAELINMGDLKNIDVLLYYAIMDFDGNVVSSFGEESLAINDNRISLRRTLRVPEDLAEGKYVLYVKITYTKDDVTESATGSEAFDVGVVSLAPFFRKGSLAYYVIWIMIISGVIGIVVVLANILSLIKKRRKFKDTLKAGVERTQRSVGGTGRGDIYIGGGGNIR